MGAVCHTIKTKEILNKRISHFKTGTGTLAVAEFAGILLPDGSQSRF
jgi:hypothetical protein